MKFDKRLKKTFNGLPELKTLLQHQNHFEWISGLNRKQAKFICKICHPHEGCHCCVDFTPYDYKELCEHLSAHESN